MSTAKPPARLMRRASNLEGEDLAEPLPAELTTLEGLRAAKIQLFEFKFSPPCAKVRALLHYYAVPFESVHATPHQKKSDLDNSYGKVPKLVINGIQINDSAVIVRTLAPILTDGTPLTAAQVELEKVNNISGLLGALEKETASSYWGIVHALRSAAFAGWEKSYAGAAVAAVVPHAGAILWPAPWAVFASGALPHGKDGPSLKHAKAFRAALGDAAFFHGAAPGPHEAS